MDKIHQRSREFAQENIYRLLIRYSIPATVGSAAFTLYNIIDRIFIGHAMGPLALSGLTVTFPLFMTCIAIGVLVGVGGGTLISLRLGERRYQEAENILGNVVALFMLGGIIMGALGLIFLKPLLLFFGATETTLPFASAYLGTLLWFVPVDFLAMGTNNCLRAEGNPRISMYTLIVGAILNIALDYLFIFPMQMGIFGAALATGISKVVSATWIMLHFRVGKYRALTLHIRNLRLKWTLVRPLMTIGLSPFIMQLVGSLIVLLLNKQLLRYSGEVAVGAMGAIFSISMMLNMPVWGLIQGAQPIIGFNYGARNFRRVRQALKASLLYAGVIGIAGLIICQSAPYFLSGLFGKGNSEFIELGGRGMRLFLCMLPLTNLDMVGIQFFQATGRPRSSILLNLFKNGLCLIPTLLLLPRVLGLDGVWLASPLCDLAAFLLIGPVLIREVRRLKRFQSVAIPLPLSEG
ncbi:MAG: MATE family efflux transporter [Kiritimatiellia bacterium]